MRILSGQDSTYNLLDLVTKKEYRYHASDMKPFVFDPLIVDPHDVARRDYLEFFVEEILAHRGDLRVRSRLEFQIKWLGYDHNSNTWEPYSNLTKLKPLHEYLLSKNLKSLIPAQFR